MTDPDMAVFAGVRWADLNHRDSRVRLEAHGWTLCGEGDWALAFRSPGGGLAARVSAFEPSYAWFVELCRRMEGNPYFPRIDLVSELEGGGHLAILEFLTQVSADEEAAFLARWKSDADPDPDLRAARAATEELNKHCQENVRFWMGIDIGDHVMRAADGHLKLIDLLGVGGGPMLDQMEADMGEFLRVIPRERCRYMLEIPHFSRDYAADDRARVEAAFARVDVQRP
ncbi:hypothetical protein ABN034_18790 [Actinopolymorpha sp. B11F2]|uniref:hypothetical protein n=1 Tax=Actinopolymorpha sp. B11F2 TaxID=3160862 RepID=UPI0032E3DE49